jgi:hypothetical protein
MSNELNIWDNNLKIVGSNQSPATDAEIEEIIEAQKAPKDNLRTEEPIKKALNSNTEIAPIKWNGTPGQLIFLFEELRNNNFFSLNMELQASIRRHFVDENGKPFKNLKIAKQNYQATKTEKPKRANELENIVNKTKTKK